MRAPDRTEQHDRGIDFAWELGTDDDGATRLAVLSCDHRRAGAGMMFTGEINAPAMLQASLAPRKQADGMVSFMLFDSRNVIVTREPSKRFSQKALDEFAERALAMVTGEEAAFTREETR